jgi:hypothetical protein
MEYWSNGVLRWKDLLALTITPTLQYSNTPEKVSYALTSGIIFK